VVRHHDRQRTLIGQPQDLLTGEYGRLRGCGGPGRLALVSTSNQEEGGDPNPDDDRLIRIVLSSGGPADLDQRRCSSSLPVGR